MQYQNIKIVKCWNSSYKIEQCGHSDCYNIDIYVVKSFYSTYKLTDVTCSVWNDQVLVTCICVYYVGRCCIQMCVCVYIYIHTHTGLFEMIVGVLTTCHTQYTWDTSICIFLFTRTPLQVFVTYLIGALYVHPLWFYKHQHAIETMTADMLQTVWNELDYHVDVCRITNGAHIEHL